MLNLENLLSLFFGESKLLHGLTLISIREKGSFWWPLANGEEGVRGENRKEEDGGVRHHQNIEKHMLSLKK